MLEHTCRHPFNCYYHSRSLQALVSCSDGLRQEWTCVVFQPGELTLGNSQCFTRSVEGYWQPMRERGLLWNTESDLWAKPGAFLETHSPLISSYLMGMDLGSMRHYWNMKGAVKTSSEPLRNIWGKVNVIRHLAHKPCTFCPNELTY